MNVLLNVVSTEESRDSGNTHTVKFLQFCFSALIFIFKGAIQFPAAAAKRRKHSLNEWLLAMMHLLLLPPALTSCTCADVFMRVSWSASWILAMGENLREEFPIGGGWHLAGGWWGGGVGTVGPDGLRRRALPMLFKAMATAVVVCSAASSIISSLPPP